jgi:membrane associated rhomboid family serine protease
MSLAMPSMTPAVKLLLILNVAAFVATDLFLNPGGMVWVERYLALNPSVWSEWFPFVPAWQLLTYGFLHGSVAHILGNALFLYFLGTMLEGTINTRRFWVLYLVSVIAAGFFQLMVGLLTTPGPILGASGGVLAIVCAMAALQPQTRIIFILFPITLRTLAILFVLMDLFNVAHQLKGDGSNVASFAHLTGAAIGYLAVRTGAIWRDPIEGLTRARAGRAAQSRADSREKLDALLAKINRDGIGSLSGREKAFLKRMSKR